MQSLEDLRGALPAYEKDTRINLSSILKESGAPGLTQQQIAVIAFASALTIKNNDIVAVVQHELADYLDEAAKEGANTAATIMAMNNIYYRFIHLVEDNEYANLPANLRMQVIGKPAVEKATFELACMAVSAINGCGMCMASHAKAIAATGASRQAVQSAVRIAAVLHAAAQALYNKDIAS